MDRCLKHAERTAVADCAGCGQPLCDDCVETSEGGQSFCFDCAFDRNLTSYVERTREAGPASATPVEDKGRGGFIASIAFLLVLILVGAGFILYCQMGRGDRTEASPLQETVWGRDDCMLTMQQVRAALQDYYADRGSYPSSLQELQVYRPGVGIACPLTGAPYPYGNTGVGYVISCPNPQEHGVEGIAADEGSIPHFESGELVPDE